ncbi:GTPase IMAP family member 4-like [Engraulis encrasicolus]|uniref:GTPase IMAP family member 4-like n=1 Tax=Engraulis encrasicolus TaxID=184585 RepID=UPI002FD571C8
MSQKHHELVERRVVVLGANGAEKTSVISALLGQTGYEIAKSPVDCVRTTAEINGRKLTCIDTPGWWRNYSAVDTAEYIKRKLVLSVLECPPGPHAFLLVVNSEALFGEQERRAVEQHVGLFGERIWERIIVVFTSGEGQKTKSVEQYVEDGGEALKWLMGRCGNRCHMLHSFQKGSQNEVSQLLAGIDEVVAKNTEPYFRCEGRKLQDVEEMRKADQKRAMFRMDMVDRKREKMNRREMVHSSPELRIVLLGWLFSGKTFAKNTILSLKEAIHRGRTTQSKRSSGTAVGRRISVVDTPGWFKHFPSQYLPDWVKAEIHGALTLDGQHPHAILLTVPVDTTFQEGHRKVIEDNMKMFGEQVWRHTMVLFTCGDLLGNSSIEEHIESEGAPLQWLVEVWKPIPRP